MSLLHSDLSDAEIDLICDGLRQNAAKIRFLEGLGLIVNRKPNGRPLVNRSHYDSVRGGRAKETADVGDGPVWGVH